MRPILFQIFGIQVPSWHFFFALGGVFAFFFAQWLLNFAINQKAKKVSEVLFGICYISGWFGARAFSIATEDSSVNTASNFVSALFEFGAMTFYGGAILSVFMGLLYLSLQKPRLFGVYFDSYVPAGVLGLGFGRLGCFLNGDDIGKPIDAVTSGVPFWAVVFPNLNDNIPRYPVQLQEALFCFFLAGGLFALGKLKPLLFTKAFGSGKIACWIALASATNRFFNEYWRGDERGFFLSTKLSTSQGIALIIVSVSLFFIAKFYFSERKNT
jgi:phosphatidylglycerol---prolipoprotein diacylglyceryl transferase